MSELPASCEPVCLAQRNSNRSERRSQIVAEKVAVSRWSAAAVVLSLATASAIGALAPPGFTPPDSQILMPSPGSGCAARGGRGFADRISESAELHNADVELSGVSFGDAVDRNPT
jgi:hypothetical protein